MKTNVAVAIVTFVVGAVLGWAVKPTPPQTQATDGPKHSRRARIAESKSRVKTVTTVVTNTVRDTVTNLVEVAREPPRGPEAWRAEMERLKEEDPAEYADRTNRWAQRHARFRAQMLQNAENKLETLAAIDTTGWTPRELETHQRYQELIAKRAELMETLRPDSDATEEQRRAADEQMEKLREEIHKASQAERNLLLNKAIREMGFRGNAATEVQKTIKTIYSTTQEFKWPNGGRGGPHGGHGGRPPRR